MILVFFFSLPVEKQIPDWTAARIKNIYPSHLRELNLNKTKHFGWFRYDRSTYTILLYIIGILYSFYYQQSDTTTYCEAE